MRTASLDVLCCPACAAALTLASGSPEADGHVMDGTLQCHGCARVFAIARGVPRFATDDASPRVSATVSGFGYQWRRANAALRNAKLSTPEVFLDFIYPVQASSFRDKVVLDGGCGQGRFTVAAAGFGARLVIGVDLSDAVDVAFENTRHLPTVLIVQADILRLPVRPVIDYAFSVGVLHHTADPRGAFLHLASRLVAGGSISAWVYGREGNGWIVHMVNPLRKVTSRLPRPVLLALSYAASLPLFVVTHGLYGPVGRHGALAWLRRRLFYYEYFTFLAQVGYREQVFIVFDHAMPAIAEYIDQRTFAEWFDAARLDDVTITQRGGNSWRGFGLVPRREQDARG